jgi:hypothetical protein
LLKFEEDTSDDARVERLRVGYCARNGCESLFYRVTCAPHPQINWPGLLNPSHELTEDEKEAAATLERKRAIAKLRNKTLIRVGVAVVALLIVFMIRQLYLGGSIPFIRQAEDFKVDRELAQP